MSATGMNTTPAPTRQNFRLQMEGLGGALLYTLCFGWIHLATVFSTDAQPLFRTGAISVFLLGLILVPLLVTLPLAFVRNQIFGSIDPDSSPSAIAPFAKFALFGLQSVAIWVMTRTAYTWIFAA